MLSLNQIVDELGRFSDLDSAPQSVLSGDDMIISLRQGGDEVRVHISRANGRVIEKRENADGPQRYSTFGGLLASPGFGNLRRLIEAQKAQLRREAPYLFDGSEQLPTIGDFDGTTRSSVLEPVSDWLKQRSGSERVSALIVDGPAGMGKTHLIRRLVQERTKDFGPGSSPPLLHIQSRGRRLTTLNDVVAGTLQTLRVSLTYEQVPVLLRHNLLQVAIDGFDELADPAGYDTAWNSLREFIEDVKSGGTLILAGRDTFIDSASVRQSLPVLDHGGTESVHLRGLRPSEAKTWLSARGWDAEELVTLQDSGLFEEDSYALRPFFLSQIAAFRPGVSGSQLLIAYPLEVLVDQIIKREVGILEDKVKPLEGSLRGLLYEFLQELARDMADVEVDAIDEGSIALIAQIVFAGSVREDDLAVLVNRALAMALLEPDAIAGRRRFPHSEIQDYFLGLSHISLLTAGELPKSIRRTPLGVDFLETFYDLLGFSGSSSVEPFATSCLVQIRAGIGGDRARRNLSALYLCALSSGLVENAPDALDAFVVDDLVLRGTFPVLKMRFAEISQLDVREADLSLLEMQDSAVGLLVADDASLFSRSFPYPGALTLQEHGRPRFVHSQVEREGWVDAHRVGAGEVDIDWSRNGYTQLLEKVCRVMLRQFWVRSIEDKSHNRVLDDSHWPAVFGTLNRRGLVTVRYDVEASGPRSDFVRVHRAKDFVDRRSDDPQILSVYEELAAMPLD